MNEAICDASAADRKTRIALAVARRSAELRTA
jgi:hypothetical protein